MWKIILLVTTFLIGSQSTAEEDEYHPRVKRTVGEQYYNHEQEKAFWFGKAQDTLDRHINKEINRNVAKNVILFLGDGMSIATLAATRAYIGQLQGLSGEEVSLHFENFPYTGLSKPYCVDSQVADSACSATAYLGGVKANEGTVGVTATVGRQDCKTSLNATNHVDSIIQWAQKEGKGTGLVTTTRVTHASPAGVYAHVAERNWEDDTMVVGDGHDPQECQDIAQQLIKGRTGSQLNVILGGGRKHFFPDNFNDKKGMQGKRHDKINLIEMWKKQKQAINATYAYVTTEEELLNVAPVDYLLGLFSPDHISYHLDGNKDEPTLEEMTVAAIQQLSRFPKGFVLFVEGGRIDHAHHDNLAKKALDETAEFSKAISAADNLTNPEDTLIVVTSDHAHVMTLSGHARRGNNILGMAGEGTDGLPYSTLSYANGPGYDPPAKGSSYREDLKKVNTGNKLYKFPAMVPLSAETHGGDDVAVFARGPWSHLFTGSYEQNYIPHAMGYAACIGSGQVACGKNRQTT